MPEHIGENTLLDWVAGRLENAQQRDVDAHVEECQECRTAVRLWAWTADEGERPDLLGTRVARFEVKGVLGAGAMGVVVRAYDPQLARDVALKRLSVAVGSHQQEARILREARALARVRHPNVVRVFEVGTHQGQPFLAMELVGGVTLEDWLDTPRTWAEIVRVFAQVARGLMAVHSAGLVHRDVKPSNIMVDDHGRAFVMDFGLVAGRGDPDARSGSPGSSGAGAGAAADALSVRSLGTGSYRVGTPLYMSPEQLGGEPIDARSDQFSFCVALYRALAGQAPFAGANLEELSNNLWGGALVPPPRRLPRHLRRLLTRGLARDPAERYPSMAALLDDLERRPRRRARAVALAVLLVAVGGAGGFWIMNRRAAGDACVARDDRFAGVWDGAVQARVQKALLASGTAMARETWKNLDRDLERYRRDWKSAYVATCRATAVDHEQSARLLDVRMECLERGLKELAATTGTLASSPVELRRVAEAVHQLWQPGRCVHLAADGASASSSPGVRARTRRLLDEERAWVARTRLAPISKDTVAQAEAWVKRAHTAGNPRLEALFMLSLANEYEMAGSYDRALEQLEGAAVKAQAVSDPTIAADAWLRMAEIHAARTHKFDEATRWLGYASAAIEHLGPGSVSRTSGEPFDQWVWQVKGILARQQGKMDQALASYRTSLRLREQFFGKSSLEVASTLNNLAIAQTVSGQLDQAIATAERALAIKERILGPHHPSVGNALITLSLNYKNLGHYARALALLDRAVAILEGEPAARLYWATALINQGIVESRIGKFAESKVSFRRGETVYAAAFGADSGQMSTVLDNEGYADFLAGDYPAAQAAHEKALAIAVKRYGEDHPSVGNIERNLGMDVLEQGKVARARRLIQSALRVRGKALGADSTDLANELIALAECDLAEGKNRSARGFAERARARVDPEDGELVAEVELVLARALWPDRARRAAARTHAEAARRALAHAEGMPGLHHQITAWLDAHPAAPSP